MNQTLIPIDKAHRDRLARLRERREEVLSMSPEKALAQIMEEKHPAALVHSFPDQDFYFLVHDIGIGDAMPLLAMASERQREYMLDMEGWHRDRFQPGAMAGWLNAMLMADPDSVATWLLKDQTELLELILFRNIQVVIREHDEDPSKFPGDFFTHDDVYYIRILDDPLLSSPEDLPPESTEKLLDDQRRSFVYRLLARLADLDHVAYQKVILEAVSIMPAEVEEALYRLRNVRMAEKGFLPFHEAVGIYQAVSPEELGAQPAKTFGISEEDDEVPPAPLYPVKLLQTGTPFSDALQEIDGHLLMQRIQMEFVNLCNQVISADQQKIQAREALRAMVEKVCGYLNIGLEAGTPGDVTAPERRAAMASLIGRLPLSQVFRAGYGQALELKWRVARWRETAWFERAGLPLTFWGESWLGILGGLVVEKPLYFDNYRSVQTLYREFRSLDEVEETGKALTDILAVDGLFADMSIDCKTDTRHLLTWQNLLFTLWARAYLELDDTDAFDAQGRLVPIPKIEFKTFFNALFGAGESSGSLGPSGTGKAMKGDFLKWLSGRSGRSPEDITGLLGSVFDDLFHRLDEELGAIHAEDIDSRYIQLFRVQ